jgi:hypothetical protein
MTNVFNPDPMTKADSLESIDVALQEFPASIAKFKKLTKGRKTFRGYNVRQLIEGVSINLNDSLAILHNLTEGPL